MNSLLVPPALLCTLLQESPTRQYLGHHHVRHPPFGPAWWCVADRCQRVLSGPRGDQIILGRCSFRFNLQLEVLCWRCPDQIIGTAFTITSECSLGSLLKSQLLIIFRALRAQDHHYPRRCLRLEEAGEDRVGPYTYPPNLS